MAKKTKVIDYTDVPETLVEVRRKEDLHFVASVGREIRSGQDRDLYLCVCYT